MTQGVIKPLVDLLRVQDVKVLQIVLDSLANILKTFSMGPATNPSADWIEEAGGMELIEQLQQHDNEDVYTKSLNIIDKYYSEGGEADDQAQSLAPTVQVQAGPVGAFAFAMPSTVLSSGFAF